MSGPRFDPVSCRKPSKCHSRSTVTFDREHQLGNEPCSLAPLINDDITVSERPEVRTLWGLLAMFSAPLRHKGCQAIVTSWSKCLLPWVEVAVWIWPFNSIIIWLWIIILWALAVTTCASRVAIPLEARILCRVSFLEPCYVKRQARCRKYLPNRNMDPELICWLLRTSVGNAFFYFTQ
jgi:hypothetical protein